MNQPATPPQDIRDGDTVTARDLNGKARTGKVILVGEDHGRTLVQIEHTWTSTRRGTTETRTHRSTPVFTSTDVTRVERDGVTIYPEAAPLTYSKQRNALGELEYIAQTGTHRYVVRRNRARSKEWLAEVYTLKAVGFIDPIMIADKLVTVLDWHFTRASAYAEVQTHAAKHAPAPKAEQPAAPGRPAGGPIHADGDNRMTEPETPSAAPEGEVIRNFFIVEDTDLSHESTPDLIATMQDTLEELTVPERWDYEKIGRKAAGLLRELERRDVKARWS